MKGCSEGEAVDDGAGGTVAGSATSGPAVGTGSLFWVGCAVSKIREVVGRIVGADTGWVVGFETGLGVFLCGAVVGSDVGFANDGERVGERENCGGFQGFIFGGLLCLPPFFDGAGCVP